MLKEKSRIEDWIRLNSNNQRDYFANHYTMIRHQNGLLTFTANSNETTGEDRIHNSS